MAETAKRLDAIYSAMDDMLGLAKLDSALIRLRNVAYSPSEVFAVESFLTHPGRAAYALAETLKQHCDLSAYEDDLVTVMLNVDPAYVHGMRHSSDELARIVDKSEGMRAPLSR